MLLADRGQPGPGRESSGLAALSNGARLIATYRGPATFFDPSYARDFITMSAR